MTETEIEALAVKYEAFGFGRVDAKGYTTHGFDPDGLAAFARAITEEAVRLERGPLEAVFLWCLKNLTESAHHAVMTDPSNGVMRAVEAIRSRSKEG